MTRVKFMLRPKAKRKDVDARSEKNLPPGSLQRLTYLYFFRHSGYGLMTSACIVSARMLRRRLTDSDSLSVAKKMFAPEP